MARCEDCIHYEVCARFADVRVILCGDRAGERCKMFKPTANIVPMGEWFSVEDRLPRYNSTVLVYRPTMAMPIVADTYYGWYGEDDDKWYEGWSLYGKNSKGEDVITHWMYLPDPPKSK